MHVKKLGFPFGIVLIGVSAALPGCGGETPPPSEVLAVDPRYESAESLIEYYNSLTTCDPIRARDVINLFHGENTLQERYIGIARSLVSVAELDYLIFSRFNELLDPNDETGHHMLSPDMPAAITEREDARAQAVFHDTDGDEHILYLVRIGDRWHVSGYTLEYDEDWTGMISDIDKFEDSMQKTGVAAHGVCGQVEAGTLQSAADARKAFGEAIIKALDFE
jgi:hypothetical protein